MKMDSVGMRVKIVRKWGRRTGPDRNWMKCYTIMFAVLALSLYSLHILYGKSFIYSGSNLAGDGLLQHYTALAYYGEYLRTICRNVFVLHTFSIPEFDLSIGLGGNIITTFGYEVLGDPLNLLAVFVPMGYTEYLYVFLNPLIYFPLILLVADKLLQEGRIMPFIFCVTNHFGMGVFIPKGEHGLC